METGKSKLEKQIFRAVYPERQRKILRFAQNDKKRAQDDK
jgi:hypothetical protein